MFVHKYCVAPERPAPMRYCVRCVYPASSAVPLAFDEAGMCSGCRTAEQRQDVDWDERRNRLVRTLERHRSKDGSGYDCIIPVSGGKDSYFQVHVIKNILGFRPLLVTYHGNNYTDVGMRNLVNMRERFDCDHLFGTPSIDVLKKMNRLGMRMMGDMNWHGHAGIFTYPIRVAVQTQTPIMIWGEHGFADLGGMHSYNDLVEFTYRFRHEHGLRGFEWYDFMEQAPKYNETLSKQELITWMYPSDDDIARVGVRGLYLSNFVRWDANDHGPLMQELYGFEPSPIEFDRTYRRMSNLDDMHENGVHDYMKFVKFGYGRATDHCCKDIRAGLMTRSQAIEIVRERDAVKPSDLQRWLKYVGWSETEFDRVADGFRDPRIWWIKDGNWHKDNLWGGESDFGPVLLSENQGEGE